MAWFKKKPDPISDRARALNDEIARLEDQIKRLDASIQKGPAQVRSPAAGNSGGGRFSVAASSGAMAAPDFASRGNPVPHAEPIFEKVPIDRLGSRPEVTNTPSHYNELGVRKYDLPALLHRLRNHFRGPAASNPKLVSYLAAGGIQGLRPLRYEKRVARNRFIVLVIGLFFMLLGLIWTYIKHSR